MPDPNTTVVAGYYPDTVVVIGGSPPSPIVIGTPAIQGPPGVSGSLDNSVTAAAMLNGLIVVKGTLAVTPCDSGALGDSDMALGITLSAASIATTVMVRRFGFLYDPSFSFISGFPIFCGPNGLLTQTVPIRGTSAFLLRVGVATSTNRMLVNFEPATVLA